MLEWFCLNNVSSLRRSIWDFTQKAPSTYLHLEFHSTIESMIRAHQPLSNFAVSNASGSRVRSPGIHSGQHMRIRDRGLYPRRKSTLGPLYSSSGVAHFLI